MGPRGAGSGRVGPSRAEWGRLGLSGVGEGLGMHWGSIKLLSQVGPGAGSSPVGVGPVGLSGVGLCAGWG